MATTTLTDLPDLLTVDEFAQWARIGRRQAYAAIRAGELPSITLGRTIRVPRAALETLLAEAVAR